jgi:hypothetical protein
MEASAFWYVLLGLCVGALVGFVFSRLYWAFTVSGKFMSAQVTVQKVDKTPLQVIWTSVLAFLTFALLFALVAFLIYLLFVVPSDVPARWAYVVMTSGVLIGCLFLMQPIGCLRVFFMGLAVAVLIGSYFS